MTKISDKQIHEITSFLEGTCNSIEQAMDRFDIDFPVEEVEDRLLDVNLERCPGCDWWVESSELVDSKGDIVVCENCRAYDKDEEDEEED